MTLSRPLGDLRAGSRVVRDWSVVVVLVCVGLSCVAFGRSLPRVWRILAGVFENLGRSLPRVWRILAGVFWGLKGFQTGGFAC